MKKKFATNLLLLITLNLLVKPLWIFGIDRNVQNILGSAEYGLYFSLFNFSLLLNILLDFGLTNFNNREISRHSQLLSKYLSNIIVVRVLLAFVYLFVSLGIALALGYNGRQLYILAILVGNQFLASLVLYLRSNLSGLHLFRTDSILSILDRSIMIMICSVLIWGNISGFRLSVEWFAYAQTASYLTTAIVSLIIVISKSKYFRPAFDRLFIISIIKQSYPYAILFFLMTIYSRVDSVMIERLLPNGSMEAGIYAQAYRLLEAFSMFPFLFAGLLLPMFSRMIKNKESTQPLTEFAFSLLFVPAIALAITCIFYRTELMDLFYHKHAFESSSILGFLMVSFVFISLNYIFGTLLTANGSIKLLNKISLIGVLLSIALNFIIIPVHTAKGAAITNMIVQLVIFSLQLLFAFKTLHISINIKSQKNTLAFLVGSIGIAYVSKLAIESWIYGFVASGILIFLSGFLLNMLKINDIIKMFQVAEE